MSTTDSDVPTRGLVHAFALDGRGGGRPLSPAQTAAALRDRSAGQTVDAPDLWLHVDRMDPGVQDWLDLAGVPPHAAEALLAEETRPRADRFADGLVVNLRGLNVNPGMEASDDAVELQFSSEQGSGDGCWNKASTSFVGARRGASSASVADSFSRTLRSTSSASASARSSRRSQHR